MSSLRLCDTTTQSRCKERHFIPWKLRHCHRISPDVSSKNSFLFSVLNFLFADFSPDIFSPLVLLSRFSHRSSHRHRAASDFYTHVLSRLSRMRTDCLNSLFLYTISLLSPETLFKPRFLYQRYVYIPSLDCTLPELSPNRFSLDIRH